MSSHQTWSTSALKISYTRHILLKLTYRNLNLQEIPPHFKEYAENKKQKQKHYSRALCPLLPTRGLGFFRLAKPPPPQLFFACQHVKNLGKSAPPLFFKRCFLPVHDLVRLA